MELQSTEETVLTLLHMKGTRGGNIHETCKAKHVNYPSSFVVDHNVLIPSKMLSRPRCHSAQYFIYFQTEMFVFLEAASR